MGGFFTRPITAVFPFKPALITIVGRIQTRRDPLDEHPHVNLATVTYLFDGEIIYRDSLGTMMPIRPGAVNWMTAGRGIVHSERTSPELKARGSRLFGLQTWVALPAVHEETDPSFAHYEATDLPVLDAEGKQVRVVVGQLAKPGDFVRP